MNLPNLSHIQRRAQNIGLRVSKYIRSAKFGGQNNAGVSIGKDTVTKTLKGSSGLKEAALYWDTTKWHPEAQKYIPPLKSISMPIGEGKKPEAERLIELTTAKAPGKPLSRYLARPKLYNQGYDETEKALESVRTHTGFSLRDRHPDNIFVTTDPKTKAMNVQLIDLDPKHALTTGSSEDTKKHVQTYRNDRITRIIRRTAKSSLSTILKPVPKSLIQKLPLE